MPAHRAHRCWTIAYFVSWALVAGGACGMLAAVAWNTMDARVIDDDAALLGIPIGVVLGCLVARATVRRRRVHRVLFVVGMLALAAGTAGAWHMFATAATRHGDGPFAGLGEVLVGAMSVGVAALGVACLAAGTTGRLAARTAPVPG